MSIDTLVGSKYAQPLLTFVNYSRGFLECAIPGVALSAGASLVGNLAFGVASTFGCKPGPMSMADSLLYVAVISPIMTQMFHESFESSRKYKQAEPCYGPQLPYGYKTIYEIMHGPTQDESVPIGQTIAPIYEFPQIKTPPAA